MCAPIAAPIIYALIAATTATVTYIEKKQAYDDQVEAYDIASGYALDLANIRDREIAARHLEERFKTGVEIDAVERQAALVDGSAEAAAALNGVSGNALNALLLDIELTRSKNITRAVRGQVGVEEQLERDRERADINSNLTLLGARPGSGPSLAAPILGVTTAGVQGYNNVAAINEAQNAGVTSGTGAVVGA